jgi:hypothetical protein
MSSYVIINGKRVAVPAGTTAQWLRKNVDSVQAGEDLLVDGADGKSKELSSDEIVGKGERITSIPKIVKGRVG